MTKARKQRGFVREHLVPLLSHYNWKPPVFDLGSGQGEIIIAFQEATNACCVGCDDNSQSIINATKKQSEVIFIQGDFCADSIDWMLINRAGLVLMCDVVEHIGEPAFTAAGKFLRNYGLLYLRFPPWHSPFGGHQHLARHWTRFIPWIHLLFPRYLRRVGMAKPLRNPDDIESVHRTKLTSSTVDGLGGWQTIYSRRYLIRPNNGHGIPAPRWLPDLFTMGIEYVLKNDYPKGGKDE